MSGVWYYALAAWRATPEIPPGAIPFSYHERSGHAGLLFGVLVACAVEGIALHLWLYPKAPVITWVLTLSTIYAAIWFLADYRATTLLPILVTPTTIVVRAGMRHSIEIPRQLLHRIDPTPPPDATLSINCTFMSTPSHWLILSEPVLMRLPYGLRKRVLAVGIEPDQPQKFVDAVQAP